MKCQQKKSWNKRFFSWKGGFICFCSSSSWFFFLVPLAVNLRYPFGALSSCFLFQWQKKKKNLFFPFIQVIVILSSRTKVLCEFLVGTYCSCVFGFAFFFPFKHFRVVLKHKMKPHLLFFALVLLFYSRKVKPFSVLIL